MDRAELSRILGLPELASQLERVDGLMLADFSGSVLKDSAARLLQRGGKRLRPAMLIAAAALGKDYGEEKVLAAAAGVELIHQASLAHDAITDDGLSETGLNLALLSGDRLMAVGFSLAAAADGWAVEQLAAAVQKMADGQALQLERRYRADTADAFYLKTIEYKTASLFGAALLIGGRLGGLSPAALKALGSYGAAFGTAFQIADDIADGEFGPDRLPGAKTAVRRRFELAQAALNALPKSRVGQGLASLAAWYLDRLR